MNRGSRNLFSTMSCYRTIIIDLSPTWNSSPRLLRRFLLIDWSSSCQQWPTWAPTVAYKPDHSTETALLKVQNDILHSLDKNNCFILLLLDLSAEFDTVDHQILLKRLDRRFEIKGKASVGMVYMYGLSWKQKSVCTYSECIFDLFISSSLCRSPRLCPWFSPIFTINCTFEPCP